MQRVISIVAFVCIFAIVVAGLPYAFGGSPCDDKQIGACIRDWIKDVLIPTGALVAALLAGYFAFHQMTVTQAQLTLAQQSARIQLRAYLSVSQADVGFEEGYAFAKLQFRNSGATPAYDVDVRLWLTGTDNPDHPLEQITSPGKSPSVLGPGATTIKTQRVDLLPDQLTQILEGRAWLFVHGYLTFTDIFHELRQLDFCYQATKDADERWRVKTTRDGDRSRDVLPLKGGK